jgi:Fe-S oxidoreductase
MGIAEIRETTESCKHCYMCRHACPTFLATKLDSHTPRGYALLLSEIDHGYQGFTPAIVDRFYQCSQCGLCREDCAYHWAEDEVVRNAREEIVQKGKAPERVRAVAERILATGSPYEQAARGVEASSIRAGVKGVDVLYFAGCSTRQRHPELVAAMDRLLGVADVRWAMLEGEGCCGTPLWELGYSEQAQKVAATTVDRIAGLSSSVLVTGCPHCARAFVELYPKWGIPLPAGLRVMHTSQYFAELMQNGKLRLKRAELGRVSYHDPCQLGRKLGEYEAPRRLIEAATGTAPVEMFHARAAAECCGAGSIMFLTDPGVADKVAARRLGALRETGCTTLVTACQNCKGLLTLAGGAGSNGLEVLDLVEMLSQSV